MVDSSMFFRGWDDIGRVLVVGPIGYFALILMLRLSRKRTLAQMNVFDFVYIVVIGNVLATTIVADDVSLARGLLGVAVLIGFQVLVSWATTRSAKLEHVVNGEPALLFHRGRFLRDSMRAQRVTEQEVLAAARMEGVGSLEEVEAIVLETDGEFSVVHATDKRHGSTLRDVPGAGRREPRPARQAARAD